jgi:hypothetical protein
VLGGVKAVGDAGYAMAERGTLALEFLVYGIGTRAENRNPADSWTWQAREADTSGPSLKALGAASIPGR